VNFEYIQHKYTSGGGDAAFLGPWGSSAIAIRGKNDLTVTPPEQTVNSRRIS